MPKNFRSVVLFLVLLAVLLFIIGFRLGKKIERIDKTFVPPSAIPSISVNPTSMASNFKTFSSKDCGISFLIPGNFKEDISSGEAQLTTAGEKVFMSCDPQAVQEAKSEFSKIKDKDAAIINNQRIDIYKVKSGKSFIIFNPVTAQNVLFEVGNNLNDLIIRTLEFGR